jgi:hypothetical protein
MITQSAFETIKLKFVLSMSVLFLLPGLVFSGMAEEKVLPQLLKKLAKQGEKVKSSSVIEINCHWSRTLTPCLVT